MQRTPWTTWALLACSVFMITLLGAYLVRQWSTPEPEPAPEQVAQPDPQFFEVQEVLEEGILVQVRLHPTHIVSVKYFKNDPGWCIITVHPEVFAHTKTQSYVVNANGSLIFNKLKRSLERKDNGMLILPIKDNNVQPGDPAPKMEEKKLTDA